MPLYPDGSGKASPRLYRALHWSGLGLFATIVVVGVGGSLVTGARLPSIEPGYGTPLERLRADGDPRDVHRALEMAARIAGDQSYLLALARSSFEQQDPETAVFALRLLAGRATADPSVRLRLAEALLWQDAVDRSGGHGRVEEARRHVERALEIAPGWPPARYHLGLVQERAGEMDEARATFQALLEVEPSFAPARDRLRSLDRASGGRP